VWQGAKQALRRIKTARREQGRRQIQERLEKTAPASLEKPDRPQPGISPRSEYAEEADIEKLLAEGNHDRAKKLLVDLIDKAASVKRFPEAEKLREWLIEIAPSALNDIIRTAEAIELAKSEGISNDFLKVWSNLHDNLTTEEFNALYYSMEHVVLPGEEIPVKQGETSPALYFVNHGKVKLYYDDKSSEILLKIVEGGEIFGQDTFFDASVWTMSAASLSRVELSILPLKNTSHWKNDHPALESKLQDLCRETGDVQAHLKQLKKNRREHKRYQVSGNVIATLLGNGGKETGLQMKGEFADISLGGLSFLLRISHKKNARILLGRNIHLQLPCAAARGKMLDIEGVLMTVRSLYSMNNEYSAHVGFKHPLTEEDLRGIIEAGESEK
jgi:CRP-like cAMP-binding protein